MRIIGGQNKGRTIYAPKGNTTRPTTDRVRESMFNSLVSLGFDFEGASVLDAFAGSGALGLEAASRGAAHVLFCEVDGSVTATLKRNASLCRLDTCDYTIRERDSLKNPPHTQHPFDLVLLDPPYATQSALIGSFVESLENAGSLADNALIVYEHDEGKGSSDQALSLSEGWELLNHKKYGKTIVDFYGKEA